MNNLEKLRAMAAQRPTSEAQPAAAPAATAAHRAAAEQFVRAGKIRRGELTVETKMDATAAGIIAAGRRRRGEA